jgi:hypothetical protein
MRMTDDTPGVNQVCRLPWRLVGSQPRRSLRRRRFGRIEAHRTLVEEVPGPTKKSAELIRINHKIDNKRDRGQHEDQVSHGVFPASAR